MVAALALWSCPSPAATQPTAAPQVEDGIPIYVNVPQVFQQCDTYQAPPILLVASANIESGSTPT